MTIGDRIKQLRESKDIGQTELAEKINVSKQTLYKYENNIVTNIPSDKIESIADELNTTPAFLMGWINSDESLPVPAYDSDLQEWSMLLPKLTPDQKASLLQTAHLFVQMNEAK